MIDPGHGGDEAGAMGPRGTKEGDVVLAISKQLAAILEKDKDMGVFLTRKRDKALTLEDRNEFAVSKGADLFISIHANAATNRKMSGIETYFLNNASDKAAEKLARRENMASKKKVSDVEHILSTMLQNYDAAESKDLAMRIQRSLMRRMGKKYPNIKNRSVRSALFYVLVGAKCPAVLVETSFISNPTEEKRLTNKKYQEEIAASIADGIRAYLKDSEKKPSSI